MIGHPGISLKKFYMVGISFKKTDAESRSRFSINAEQGLKAYQQSSACLEHFLLLSTCNRTEIYGFAPCEYVLLAFIRSLSGASREEVAVNVYIQEGEEAVKHLLTVAAGLDSQIPGDYEIIGQIRNAFQVAKSLGRSNGYIERVVNQANQVSKAIKNSTAFSDGTVSVSYSVAKEIGKIIREEGLRKICIVGLGKIGHNTLRYLLQHAPSAAITLVNRDEKKRLDIANKHGLSSFAFSELESAVRKSEIVIVATSVAQPILYLHHLEASGVRYVFDLSVPRNVAQEVYLSQAIRVFDVDQISATVNATLGRRMAEIPKVKAIVESKAQEFFQWQERRKLRTVSAYQNEESINGKHGTAHLTGSFSRKQTCFMADQCCDGKATVPWLSISACPG